MTPFYSQSGIELHVGDCRTVLAALPVGSVQCCVTSPPYYGLRSYDGEPLVWGGVPDCAHVWGEPLQLDTRGSGSDDGQTGRQRGETYGRNALRGCYCPCGAWLGDLGLEPTPQEYVAHLLEVLAGVWRVLRPDGVLLLNLGDSFANDGKWGGSTGGKHTEALHTTPVGRTRQSTGLKPKELIGIPWRVAFALQDADWWLRSDIIWSKPNAFPEPVNDRPTKAHEYVFLLTKAKQYYFNGEAIAEPTVSDHGSGNGFKRPERVSLGGRGCDEPRLITPTRHSRSVWTLNSEAFPGAHFATMPKELAKRCILAGSRPGDIILDPFAGSGTSLLTAKWLGRKATGIELNPTYAALAVSRLEHETLARPYRVRPDDGRPLLPGMEVVS